MRNEQCNNAEMHKSEATPRIGMQTISRQSMKCEQIWNVT
jgi:hypothetical protein